MSGSHSHAHSHFGDIAKQTTSRLALSLFITLAFVFIEAIAGVVGTLRSGFRAMWAARMA